VPLTVAVNVKEWPTVAALSVTATLGVLVMTDVDKAPIAVQSLVLAQLTLLNHSGCSTTGSGVQLPSDSTI
jgi:hypothetical protein